LPQSITIKTQLLGANTKKAGNSQLNLELPANSEKEVEQTIQVSKPLLWTPETPHLFLAQIQIVKGKNVIDNAQTTFGVRSIKFTTENGFQLNGKTVKLNGGCVHHDNGCLGAAAFDRAEERRVELL
jgi:beta-galactosidase